MPAERPDPGLPQGLSWSWEMDFSAVLAALSDGPPLDLGTASSRTASTGISAPGLSCTHVDPDSSGTGEDTGPASEQAVLAALDQGEEPLPAGIIAARVAERLPPGPDLVAWLETAPAGDLSDYDLPGSMTSWRRVAAYAQARELARVAQIASRAAQRDPKIGTGPDGRPARVPPSAVAEVSLALAMTTYSAAAWTDLAVELTWRLPATGTALAQGLIDLVRAKLIAQYTGLLSDAAARAVEERVLPAAGRQTTSMLSDALSRAVIAVDPEGAQRRKEQAERRAKVSLYPEHEGTAAITAQGLPVISATAAMARITAIARAMESAGSGGGMDFLRTQVLVGLLLGTLPLIPPAADGPPDYPPSGDGPPDDPPGAGSPPDDPPGADRPPDDPPSAGGPPDGAPDGPPRPGPGDGFGPEPSGGPTAPGGSADSAPGHGPGRGGESRPAQGSGPGDGADDGPWAGFPDPRDEDAPDDTGEDRITSQPVLTGSYRPGGGSHPGQGPPGLRRSDEDWPGPRDDDGWLETGPLPDWPGLPPWIPPSPIPPGLAAPGGGPGMSRPVPGLLDVAVPWHTLSGASSEPGRLGRIGPITALEARHLADCAARDPAAIWRIVITNRAGQALAVTRLPRRWRGRTDDPPPPGPGAGIGLVGRITVTIPEDVLDAQPPLPGSDCPPILRQALGRATKALARARANAQADAAAGGCAHLDESPAYRIPPRLRDYITARDVTCRFTTCRQPVWHCDIDHTTPHDQGGRTCKCNNGGLCRTHHQIKQLPGWTLHQPSPGIFQWTTPSGRTYTTTPDTYPL